MSRPAGKVSGVELGVMGAGSGPVLGTVSVDNPLAEGTPVGDATVAAESRRRTGEKTWYQWLCGAPELEEEVVEYSGVRHRTRPSYPRSRDAVADGLKITNSAELQHAILTLKLYIDEVNESAFRKATNIKAGERAEGGFLAEGGLGCFRRERLSEATASCSDLMSYVGKGFSGAVSNYGTQAGTSVLSGLSAAVIAQLASVFTVGAEETDTSPEIRKELLDVFIGSAIAIFSAIEVNKCFTRRSAASTKRAVDGAIEHVADDAESARGPAVMELVNSEGKSLSDRYRVLTGDKVGVEDGKFSADEIKQILFFNSLIGLIDKEGEVPVNATKIGLAVAVTSQLIYGAGALYFGASIGDSLVPAQALGAIVTGVLVDVFGQYLSGRSSEDFIKEAMELTEEKFKSICTLSEVGVSLRDDSCIPPHMRRCFATLSGKATTKREKDASWSVKEGAILKAEEGGGRDLEAEMAAREVFAAIETMSERGAGGGAVDREETIKRLTGALSSVLRRRDVAGEGIGAGAPATDHVGDPKAAAVLAGARGRESRK